MSEKRKFLKFFNSITPYTKVKAYSVPRKAEHFAPGDIIYFSYPEDGKGPLKQRIALIVSCNRGPTGLFISTRYNLLLMCFELDSKFDALIKVIVRTLYKRRRKSNYYKVIKTLTEFLSVENARTYDLKKMRGMYQIEIEDPEAIGVED